MGKQQYCLAHVDALFHDGQVDLNPRKDFSSRGYLGILGLSSVGVLSTSELVNHIIKMHLG